MARLEATQGRIRSIIQLVMDSGISAETVSEELRKEEEKKHFLEAHLQELTQKNKVAEISEAKVKELLERSREFIRTHNVAECRNFIDTYVKEVVVYNDKVEVFFKINVPDEASGAVVPLQSSFRSSPFPHSSSSRAARPSTPWSATCRRPSS